MRRGPGPWRGLQRAVRKEREQGQAGIVDGALEPAVQQAGGCGAVALLDQVHEQEGQVVEDVDAGEIIVELDAVEQDRAVAEEHDVGEVEVAVTVADATFGAATVEERPVAGQEGLGQGVELADGVGVKTAGTAASRSVRLPRATSHMAAWPPLSGRGEAAAWEVATVSARRSIRVGQAGRRGDAVEFRLGREAAHFQQPFDRWAVAVQGEAGGVGGDGRTRR